MGLKLDNVIPWGRSFEEYVRMFHLTPTDLQSSILDCAGGPASFNAGMYRRGHPVISCDPIYQFTAAEISQRIQDTYSTVVEGVRANLGCYVWRDMESPDRLGAVRMAAMEDFLADLPRGFAEGRYRVAQLPDLPFGDRTFSLALCSHLLFTYSDLLSAEFHWHAIRELCRIASQVRIFPLLDLAGEVSPHLKSVVQQLQGEGYQVAIEPVSYEFQKNGNQMLKIGH
ncbi:MAG TPA: SAM-dependent methyltransferase [Oscillatoriales cyanobacterium M59_W2019_021]|nr:MAG: SAM-dependent methyltransferase [Cyanobacteria bacterium J055]HIK33338.1 SAM-dependent methyltransferase [Oscillatoriales cyanobacterium M4454_W2019_049]HIK50052.1 SAM-dependent methyltransferase [Oscillatoriales cyanobacterium M59_W2019_021]